MKHLEEAANSIVEKYNTTVFSSSQLYTLAKKHGIKIREIKEFFLTPETKIGRGMYDISKLISKPSTFVNSSIEECIDVSVIKPETKKISFAKTQRIEMINKVGEIEESVYVPSEDMTYVAWGDFVTVKKIIASRQFFPTFISGLSGNGKTMMVEQACAKLGREFIRVQITPETDEIDLIGGFRLINGETVFSKGPVIKAMESGCIVLIDEIDRGSNKLLCLQGILEGKPILIKKINAVIVPKAGFNVFATANTKGKGSEDGRFSGATILDEAFIERFYVTIEQEFPTKTIEENILTTLARSLNILSPECEVFIKNLVTWSEIIRKTYKDEGVSEIISTRRLCHIIKAFSIFGDSTRAINMCIARFDDENKNAFSELYNKLTTHFNDYTKYRTEIG